MTENHSFPEPKLQLTLAILQQDGEITWHMDNLQYDKAAHDIALLLRRIELNETDTEMLALKKIITLQNYDQISEEQINDAYEKIHDYLNRTYYKGFSNNRPPTRAGSIQNIGEKLKQ